MLDCHSNLYSIFKLEEGTYNLGYSFEATLGLTHEAAKELGISLKIIEASQCSLEAYEAPASLSNFVLEQNDHDTRRSTIQKLLKDRLLEDISMVDSLCHELACTSKTGLARK